MTVLLYEDERFEHHDTGPHHPERAARLPAVHAGLAVHGLMDGLTTVPPRAATDDELHLVHPEAYVSAVEGLCAAGGGHLDPDTVLSRESAGVARLAAGAGVDAAERIGVSLTDQDQLDPEQSTSAIVLHHPKAKYFNV